MARPAWATVPAEVRHAGDPDRRIMRRRVTDGYIFGMIRNGRGLMPTYNRIEEMDRWDVVNYVRGLQGKLPQPVPTGPVGCPGETGACVARVPRSTAPTRPVPYYRRIGIAGLAPRDPRRRSRGCASERPREP